MQWGDVRIFLAVARCGSLGAAARALRTSHPTVGRRLRALESDTGQTLFQRTREGLLLTDAGHAVLRMAEAMEAQALAMQRRLAGEDERHRGILRISSADWFGSHVLPPVLAELVRLHPGIVPELIADARLLDLSRQEADIVFRNVPFREADIVQRQVMPLVYGLYAATSVADPVRGDGSGARLILVSEAHDDYPDSVWLRRLLPRATVALRSNSRPVQAEACALGLGLAVLPRPLGDRTPGLRRVELGEAPPARAIWMGYHHDLRRMDRLRAMADIVGRLLAASAPAAAEQS